MTARPSSLKNLLLCTAVLLLASPFSGAQLEQPELPRSNDIWEERDHFIGAYARFRKGERWGVIGRTGNVVIPAKRLKEEIIVWPDDRICLWTKNEGWSVTDAGGEKILLDASVDWLGEARQGYAWFKTPEKKFGFLTLDGKISLGAKYDDIRSWSLSSTEDYSSFSPEPFAAVKSGKTWGVVNMRGEEIVKLAWASARILVRKNSKQGKGGVIFDVWTDEYALDTKHGAFGVNGDELFSAIYDGVDAPLDDFVVIQSHALVKNGTSHGFHDLTTGETLAPVWLDVTPLGHGYVKLDRGDADLHIYDRRSATVAWPLHFCGIEPFSEGMAAVRSRLLLTWGFIDVEGRPQVGPALDEMEPELNFPWDEVEPFRNGVAVVRLLTEDELDQKSEDGLDWEDDPEEGLGMYGMIAKTGKVIIDPKTAKVTYATLWPDGRIQAKKAGQWGFLQPDGRFKPDKEAKP